jgi:hypothetical protein
VLVPEVLKVLVLEVLVHVRWAGLAHLDHL